MRPSRHELLEKFLGEIEEILFSEEKLFSFRPNKNLNNCWETLGCKKKRCPVFGKREARCWHFPSALCCKSAKLNRIGDKWKKRCKVCPVFLKATCDLKSRLNEFYNNLVFYQLRIAPNKVNIEALTKCAENLSTEADLTPREKELLFLMSLQVTVDSAAKRLGVSRNTIKTHLKNLYRKIKVSSKLEISTLVSERINAAKKCLT